ncbi:unnamed protein product [Brachionus calyciflorus]|uniref:Uncharacterized protein n=1 Tax=Brachionus calyciflorus TaxID=104777 RepID=A0A814B434_9BILA|nr:unnamed protein product [Brachionus calyciflorus]
MSLENSSAFIENLLIELNRLKQNTLTCDSFSLNSSHLLKNINFLILSPNSLIETQIDTDVKVLSTEKPEYEPVLNSTSSIELDYDYSGALWYIYFVIFWYAFCVICMISIQTKKSDLDFYEDSDESDKNTAHGLLKRIRDDKIKREALEELIKPGFRDKMWDIYSETPNAYKIRKFESKKIQNIDRKLKQYYSQTGDSINNYKTVDLSQIDRQRQQKDTNLFLFKDVNKLDNSTTTYNTINSAARNSFTINSFDSNPRFNLLNMNFEPPKTPKPMQSTQPNHRFHVEKIKEITQ